MKKRVFRELYYGNEETVDKPVKASTKRTAKNPIKKTQKKGK